MGIFSKRWPVTDSSGDTLALVARGKSLELRRAGIGGALLHAYEDPQASFGYGVGNKDFYVRGGQYKRIVKTAIIDAAGPGGGYTLRFGRAADGDNFRRWIDRRSEK